MARESATALRAGLMLLIIGLSPLVMNLWQPGLVREGPQAQLFLGDLPQTGQPVRLNDQEEHDQRTEHQDLDVRHGGAGKRQAEQVGNERQGNIEEDRQQQDESSAEEGA